MCYTCPKHDKSPLDGHMGTLTKIKQSASLKLMLVSLTDLTSAFERYFARENSIDPTLPKHRVVEFIPTARADLATTFLTLACCGGIRHGFEWRFNLNDKRRRGNATTGKFPKHLTMTAINMRRVQIIGTGAPHMHP